jgi:hypothetical protein
LAAIVFAIAAATTVVILVLILIAAVTMRACAIPIYSCSDHPRDPACAQQDGENFPIGSQKEEEEEAVFIRGVNTNEESPNAQHAQHRPVQHTGAMSA